MMPYVYLGSPQSFVNGFAGLREKDCKWSDCSSCIMRDASSIKDTHNSLANIFVKNRDNWVGYEIMTISYKQCEHRRIKLSISEAHRCLALRFNASSETNTIQQSTNEFIDSKMNSCINHDRWDGFENSPPEQLQNETFQMKRSFPRPTFHKCYSEMEYRNRQYIITK